MFIPRVLKFNGGYLTYSFETRSVDISPNFEDAFVFTTKENYSIIEFQKEHYSSGGFCGFDSDEEENKWQNPQWIDVKISL